MNCDLFATEGINTPYSKIVLTCDPSDRETAWLLGTFAAKLIKEPNGLQILLERCKLTYDEDRCRLTMRIE